MYIFQIESPKLLVIGFFEVLKLQALALAVSTSNDQP